MEKVFIIEKRYFTKTWSEYFVHGVYSSEDVAYRYLYELRSAACNAECDTIDFRIVSYDVIFH